MQPRTPPNVHDWLAGLGLAQYAESFADHAIEPDLLPDLTDAALEELGVRMLGHRMKLMRAVDALKALRDNGQPPEAAALERRQLTVMFCDLVGSTALSQRMDAEDLRALMQRYQQLCGAAVARGDGHVAQYLGDGLMVYFGWPRAHEDDAARSLAVALEIIDLVKTIPAPEPLRVRIGIATGAVVVGDSGDGDASVPKTAVGETPNLAARVQALAQPDQVLIAASTRRLVGDSFDCADLGEHTLKGFERPVQLWRVLGEGRADGRFAAAHGARLSPMVNRELETALLMDRWQRAGEGAGQAVLLVGEPGIGKSRALAELCQRVGSANVLLRLQCSALHHNSAFHPVIGQLQRSAGFERADTPGQRLDKLEALLSANSPAARQAAPLYAALLSLPLDRYPPLRASPAKVKRDTIVALVDSVVDAARRHPTVLLFEDLHWMDPSTLEVVDALLPAIRRAAVLLVMTSRADPGRPWAQHPHLTTLTLVGLNRGHSLQLAEAVAAQYKVPAPVLERIVAHTDGVPLFVEEVTRSVLEGGALRVERLAQMAPAGLAALDIPATLADSLTARLDTLGAAKRLAQMASVIGRQFRHDVLQALAGLGAETLAEQLVQLAATGLISRSGTPQGEVFTFHHALIQDAAYESMLRSDRRALHAQLGEVLATQFPEIAEFEPELVARHFSAGEVHARAVPLWLRAGQRAWQRAAVKEAIAHLGTGLAMVQQVPDETLRATLELGLQSTLGVVYFAAVSYAAPQAQEAFLRAEALCAHVPDLTMKVPVLYGLGAFHTMKGDIRAGHQAFERLHAETEAARQPRLQLYAQSVLAWSYFNCGDYARSLAAADRVRALYDPALLAGPRLSAADPKVISECFRALSLWSLGLPEQARQTSDGVLTHARALGDPYSLAYALNFATLRVPELCGDYALVLERAEEGVRLARELGYPFMEVSGLLWRGWAMGDSGHPEAALDSMAGAFDRLHQQGVRYHYAELMAVRARLLLRVGQVGAAQLAISEALGQVGGSGEASVQVDVALAEGEVLLAAGGEQRPLAEAAFRVALEEATAQGALGWQLRAATALARLAIADGDGEDARALLQPLLDRFTEGHDTADLRQAQGLLATLA